MLKKKSKISDLYNYLKIVFLERGKVRFFSIIWYVPMLFALGTILLYSMADLLHTFSPAPLPIEKLSTQKGSIKYIKYRRKGGDSLVLITEDNKELTFAFYSNKKERKLLKKKLEGKNKVTIWYQRDRTSITTIKNVVKDITKDGKSITLYKYNYERALKSYQSSFEVIKNAFYVFVFSGLMIWLQNIKEQGFHRLARMNEYRKNKRK